jgi:hypothetical protein
MNAQVSLMICKIRVNDIGLMLLGGQNAVHSVAPDIVIDMYLLSNEFTVSADRRKP